jgi:hypothetical protein
MITWECDYPHSDSVWPNAPERVMEYMGGLPDADINKITHENAMRIFRFDPFRHVPRAEATAGALRAQATDVDLSLRSNGRGKSHDGIVTTLTLAQMSSR